MFGGTMIYQLLRSVCLAITLSVPLTLISADGGAGAAGAGSGAAAPWLEAALAKYRGSADSWLHTFLPQVAGSLTPDQLYAEFRHAGFLGLKKEALAELYNFFADQGVADALFRKWRFNHGGPKCLILAVEKKHLLALWSLRSILLRLGHGIPESDYSFVLVGYHRLFLTTGNLHCLDQYLVDSCTDLSTIDKLYLSDKLIQQGSVLPAEEELDPLAQERKEILLRRVKQDLAYKNKADFKSEKIDMSLGLFCLNRSEFFRKNFLYLKQLLDKDVFDHGVSVVIELFVEQFDKENLAHDGESFSSPLLVTLVALEKPQEPRIALVAVPITEPVVPQGLSSERLAQDTDSVTLFHKPSVDKALRAPAKRGIKRPRD